MDFSIRFELDKLIDLAEERDRIINSLKLTPSANDTTKIEKQLVATQNIIQANYLQCDTPVILEYKETLKSITGIDTSAYELVEVKPEPEVEMQTSKITRKKSVHFDETVQFQPYTDNPFSNQEIFAQQQQQMTDQDTQLLSLSDSVSRQHNISLALHDEVRDQNRFLDDLENQVDTTDRKLERAKKRLAVYGKKAKENGRVSTIIILTVILFMLLLI